MPRPSCDAYFNIWSRADPVSWKAGVAAAAAASKQDSVRDDLFHDCKVEPLLPPPTRDGVLVASRATRDWVTEAGRGRPTRVLPLRNE